MSDGTSDLPRDSVERNAWIDEICDRFEAVWRAGRSMAVPEFLRSVGIDPDTTDADLLRELGRVEAAYRTAPPNPVGVAPDVDQTASFGGAAVPGAQSDVGIGSVLAGKYKLTEQIGTGGMGDVWMAQQTAPVKRAVAVKVIKVGMDSRSVLARFEAERQALAIMDHPNIAKVLDAGTTPGGRPFFVMELVKGVPITEFCDERKLTPRQRLELFVPVCQAIQHAHMKGIIHRDIKPGNVLVALYDDKPVPKVIDFGVAKATGEPLTDRTLMTGFGALVGTPEYMSPEQASLNQLDIDTRSDVYSLGVLLYELLTGTTPVDRKSFGRIAINEVLRVVREVDAPRPSQKLSTSGALPSIAANRGTEPAKLSRLFRGELDWVLLKALEKDRTRRYESANAFADDVQRYLDDEVVTARPPSRGYRFQKFLRKNRGPVFAASLVLVALVAGIVGTTAGLFEAKRQKGEADTARADETKQRERAEENETIAQREKQKALAVATSSTLDQAQQICESGDVIRGLRVMAKALTPAIQSGDAALEEAVRFNLDAWLPRAYRVRWFVGTTTYHSAACSNADGSVVVTGSPKGELQVWDTQHSRKPIREFRLDDTIQKLAWQPNGNQIAIQCGDGTLRLWQYGTDFQSARVIRLWAPTKGLPVAHLHGRLAFHPDGSRLLVGIPGPSAILLNVATGERIGSGFAHNASYCNALAFSPDGKRVVLGTPDLTARVYDTATGKPVGPLVRTPGPIFVVAVSPDGTKFLTGHSVDHSFRVWDVTTGEPAGPRVPTGGTVLAAAFSPNGDAVWAGGWSPTTRLWDWRKGTVVGTPFPIEAYSLAYLSGGQSLMVSGPVGTGIWELSGRGNLWTGDPLPAIPTAAAFRPNGTELAVSIGGGRSDNDHVRPRFVHRYRATTGAPDLPQFPARHNGGWVLDLKYSSDGKSLYGAEGSGVTVWDADTGVERARLTDPRATKAAFMNVALSAGDRFVAANGLQEGTPTVAWNTVSRRTDFYTPWANGYGFVLAFAPGTTRLYDAPSGQVTGYDLSEAHPKKHILFESQFGFIHSASYRADGGALTLVVGGNHVEFDPKTGRRTGFSISGMTNNRPHYTPDGRLLYTSDPLGGAAWHLRSGKRIGPCLGTNAGIVFAVSPDGTSVVTIGDDRRPQLWRVPRPSPGSIEDIERLVRTHTGFAPGTGSELLPSYTSQ